MEEYYEEIGKNDDLNEPKKSSIGSYKDFLDGSLLTRGAVVRQFPFVIFLVVIAVIYIGNRYHAEKIVRQTMELQSELKELRYEAISSASELMFISKQSEVAKMVKQKGLGLEETLEPPKKIIVEKVKE